MHIYNCIEVPIPDYLNMPIVSVGQEIYSHKEPRFFLSPEINGEVSNYFDWYGAGTIQCGKDYSTMHRSEGMVKMLYYGFDLKKFYLRLDFMPKYKLEDLTDYLFNLNLATTEGHYLLKVQLQIIETIIGVKVELTRLLEDGSCEILDSSRLEAAAKVIIEIAIPQDSLKLQPKQEIKFHFTIEKNRQPLERQPARDFFCIHVPDKYFEDLMWHV